ATSFGLIDQSRPRMSSASNDSSGSRRTTQHEREVSDDAQARHHQTARLRPRLAPALRSDDPSTALVRGMQQARRPDMRPHHPDRSRRKSNAIERESRLPIMQFTQRGGGGYDAKTPQTTLAQAFGGTHSHQPRSRFSNRELM